MRNPFPRIGNVIKYEFKHSSKLLLPLFTIMLCLGVLSGFSFRMGNFEAITYSSGAAFKNFIAGLMIFVFFAFVSIASIITIVNLYRRFKKGMLEDEAYLNLSLPITIGEHLWGRLITDIIWLLVCSIVILVSYFLFFVCSEVITPVAEFSDFFSFLSEKFKELDLSLGKMTALLILTSITSSIWTVTLLYVVNALKHLFKTSKGIVTVLIFIALFILFSLSFNVFSLIDFDTVEFDEDKLQKVFSCGMIILSGFMLVWSAIYFAITQVIFTKKLNLE